MYFDFDYYYKVLKHVWGKSWPHRRKTLFKLLVIVPLKAAFMPFSFCWTMSISKTLAAEDKPTDLHYWSCKKRHNTHASIMSADGDKFNDFFIGKCSFLL